MDAAFDSFWVPLLGFFFLPWTTLAWAVAYAPVKGVSGFGWFLVVFAFVVDITTYTTGHRAQQRARRGVAVPRPIVRGAQVEHRRG